MIVPAPVGTIAGMDAGALLGYVASAMVVAWGTAHIAPTRAVAASFEPISPDNRRILIMEWIAEGITHISIGLLVILVTAIEGAGDPTTQLVYRVAAAILVALAALTTVTGARTPMIWFRVCPYVLSSAAALLVVGSLL